jgi:hypothetical protein
MAASVLAGCLDDRVIAENLSSSSHEECGNGFDDDGDGRVDDGCVCGFGETQPCFTSDLGRRQRGQCADGRQRCNAEGAEFGEWGPCEGSQGPSEEACDGELDDDCDGAIDEGCACTGDRMRPCATEPGTGPCRAGMQSCEGGTWSACTGAVRPRSERCGNGIDDDCDGTADEGCGCEPVPERCGDGVDNDCDGQVDEPACNPGGDAGIRGPTWTRFFRGSGNGKPTGIGVDGTGNVYVAGSFRDSSFTLEPDGVVSDVGTINGFVARYTQQGQRQWSHGYGGEQFVDFRALAVEADGTSHAAGLMSRQARIGETRYDAGRSQDVLVVVHDDMGTVRDTHLYSGTLGNAQGRAIDVSAAGVAVGGVYGGQLDLGGGPLGQAEDERGFAGVFDPPMSLRWSRVYAGNGRLFVDGVGLGEDGGSCFGGRFDTATDLGQGSVQPEGGSDIWLARYAPDGSPEWDHAFGSPGDDKIRDAARTPSGHCVGAGDVQGSVSVAGAGTLPGRGGTDAVVFQVGSGGMVRWAHNLGGSGYDSAEAIAAAPDGTVYVAGTFQGQGDLAGVPLSSTGGSLDVFVLALDPDGTARWARAFGGSGDERATAVAHDPRDGAVLVAGSYNGPARIGAASATGSDNGFVHRFIPP